MVIVGLAASWILVCFPFPQTSRVELRKSLARTIQDIGKAFGILSANAISGLGSASPEQVKGFNQLAIELRRQVSQEYTLLHNSAYEPPLRGRFPVQSYKLLLEKVDNMADLVIGMVILFFFFQIYISTHAAIPNINRAKPYEKFIQHGERTLLLFFGKKERNM
jgi:hypothetical protein